MPERIQLSRSAGWRKPDGAIVVSRPTKWGNPFQIGGNRPHVFVHDGMTVRWETPRSDDAVELAKGRAVSMYRAWLGTGDIQGLSPESSLALPDRLAATRRKILGDLRSLADRDLACWCPLSQPCHADVLLELANCDAGRG